MKSQLCPVLLITPHSVCAKHCTVVCLNSSLFFWSFLWSQAVVSRPEALQPHMLNLEAGECVAVNFAGRLATLPDSSVLRSSPKDATLKVCT